MLLNYSRKLICLLACLVGLGLVVIARPDVVHTTTQDPMRVLEVLGDIHASGYDAQVSVVLETDGRYTFYVLLIDTRPQSGYDIWSGDIPYGNPPGLYECEYNESYELCVTGPWYSQGRSRD